ncbi:TFCD-C domain-containing protein [Mycena chlorophos]|uniref:TFCD-C domain-containing protein n=1 Tax=Mycena chlorophos TaxID=658473 RepID=A0A8H6VQS1_MYCCL|nr:TFCD-C domain-containing protein [Mycena chlorophos]
MDRDGDDLEESRVFATFERHSEFVDAQATLLRLDLTQAPSPDQDKDETALFRKLSNILDEYQEQAHLLDPFLEQLVGPVVAAIKSRAQLVFNNPAADPTNPARIERVASLLYCYVKSRGYKTINRYFPHEIADLALARACMTGVAEQPKQWALRYAGLLWLSLICMIPFDLVQFDEGAEGETADALEKIARPLLERAGLERDGAALMLARFYIRKDTRLRFEVFLSATEERVVSAQDAFTVIGLLQVLCELAKSGPAELVQQYASRLFAVSEKIESNRVLDTNTLVRKLKTKLVARIPLRILPPPVGRRKGRALAGEDRVESEAIAQDEIEIPESVEGVLEQLFKSLQDKDTIVRWSAAKSVARISERLPSEFADQVLDTVMGLFAIHSIAAASLYDLPAIAESTWHGACLACAEMARRGLVSTEALPTLMEWLSKALYFDLRKGAHSIGSNVRDAAAYVLWSLARAQSPDALKPHAGDLARRLVTVALYDREIHIRRAASASFQEHVGRTSLFPHGIDVLRKTDFYAVSVRRNAFLVAAPQVAEHDEYREFLFDHLLNVTARHWDISMRQLGAQSLRLVCAPHLQDLGPVAISRAAKLLSSPDTSDLHGAFLVLAEIASAYRNVPNDRSREIFECISLVPERVLLGPRNELVTAAACVVLARSISRAEAQQPATALWRKLLEGGLKHRSATVQESAASALGAFCSLWGLLVRMLTLERTLIREMRKSGPAVQQSLGRVLGAMDYDAFPTCLPDALSCLLDCVGVNATAKLTVEARRNCYAAVPQIVRNLVPRLEQHLSAATCNALVDAMLHGLEDYTIDERGDVGSWVRIACLRGLTAFCEAVIPNASNLSAFEQYFPVEKYHAAVAGVLKQGVERLDNVRQDAGDCLQTLLALAPPAVRDGGEWTVRDLPLVNELFSTSESGWKDGAWLFPRAVRLLDVPQYRPALLAGMVLSLASRTESTQRPVARALVDYSNALPLEARGGYSLLELTGDLLARAQINLLANSIVVPVLQTFNVLLEADALQRLPKNTQGLSSLRELLAIATRNVARLKNVQRIQESMKIVSNLLRIPELFTQSVDGLAPFLRHQFPHIRLATSEYLYLVLQSVDVGQETDEAEEVLLETEWSAEDIGVAEEGWGRLKRALIAT